jgi:hypothetical protein
LAKIGDQIRPLTAGIFWFSSRKVTGRSTLPKSSVASVRPMRTLSTSLISSCAYHALDSSERLNGGRPTMPL